MDKSPQKSLVLGELVETSQLISNLKCKINGIKPKTYQNINYLQYLTRVLANKIVLIGGIPKTITDGSDSQMSSAQAESLSYLLKKQKEINEVVSRYKRDKLRQLVEALAAETFSLSDRPVPPASSNKLVEDKRIREAWILAQETISQELVQVEVSHFVTRCGQIYEQNISDVAEHCFNFDASQNVNLELWSDKAQALLKREIEVSMQELTSAYEESLGQMRKNKISPPMHFNSKQLLSDYADVIAHKALIDARLTLLQENTKGTTIAPEGTFVSSLIKHEDVLSSLMDDDQTYDAEFAYIYQQSAKECEDKIAGKQLSKDQVKSIAQIFDWPEVNDLSSLCEKCTELRGEIGKTRDQIQLLAEEQQKELQELRQKHEAEVAEIKEKWDNQRNTLASQYEIEATTLRERARKLEHRLSTMDSEHSAHINDLRAAYQRSIDTELDTDAETRKRYKEEIKQLRGLCEKGLLAMENSHRRILAETEEKHRVELESLRNEKEQALSEETQATLAALDAMRKAHEQEVQKEIAKFKQEFLKQVQAREDVGVLHKEHE